MSEQIHPLTLSMPVVDHWRGNYNWFTVVQDLKDFGKFMTTIDGAEIT
jgi:hypothetical protein